MTTYACIRMFAKSPTAGCVPDSLRGRHAQGGDKSAPADVVGTAAGITAPQAVRSMSHTCTLVWLCYLQEAQMLPEVDPGLELSSKLAEPAPDSCAACCLVVQGHLLLEQQAQHESSLSCTAVCLQSTVAHTVTPAETRLYMCVGCPLLPAVGT
jgi:hypothetical protein